MKIRKLPVIGQVGWLAKKFFDLADEQRFHESERDYQDRQEFLLRKGLIQPETP